MVSRLSTALAVALCIALLDIWLSGGQVEGVWDIHGPMFWFMLLNRLSIGFFVAIVGIVTVHPLFGFKMFPIRGAFVGIWISLPMAASIFFEPTAVWSTFWMIVLSGAVYGMIIDSVATKVAGQGKKLLHPNNA